MLSSVEVEVGEGPTLTMREPNSTPMVTSWWGEKRPSHRRIVSYGRRSVSGRWLCGGSNRRLEREDYTGFAGPAVADTDELGDVVPRL